MAALEFDLPGVRIGVAEYEAGPTGCTVFAFDRPLAASADVRGGSPGTMLAEDIGLLRAVCFAGGSLLGLEAVTGVASELFAQRGHEHVDWGDVPAVGGAILFDFDRPNGVYPDKALGAAALAAARPGYCPTGRVGAGRNVRVGKGAAGLSSEPGGQGAAIRSLGRAKVLAVVVVNALGAVVDRRGQVVRGHLHPQTGQRLDLHTWLGQGEDAAGTQGNTTLTLLLTNQKMSPPALRQVARQVHASMGRSIQPFHTSFDGDVLFAVTTGEVDEPALRDPSSLGVLAAEAVWDAVLDAVAHD
ncbi:MAG TPA: P1 family peptidase [Phenylobacterium sp.]|uniref:P1 family peptidase n=1 Tax=Phenylobacterium sp. TaxID=1871053 RepID=UPI002F91C322